MEEMTIRNLDHTIVDQLFGGQLLSTVICDTCKQSYQMLEPFMDLSLPVPKDQNLPVVEQQQPSKSADRSQAQLKMDGKGVRKEAPESNKDVVGGLADSMAQVLVDDAKKKKRRRKKKAKQQTHAAVDLDLVANSIRPLASRLTTSKDDKPSVMTCLNIFTDPEKLTGENKYGCENCTRIQNAADPAPLSDGSGGKNVLCDASKHLLVVVPPAVLTLHLKRFVQVGEDLVKAKEHIDFPLILDLAPYCSAAAAGVGSVSAGQSQVLYSLYGVIEHSGEMDKGHYIAFVKIRPDGSKTLAKFLQQQPLEIDDIYCLLNQHITAEPSPPSASYAVIRESSDEGAWYQCSDSKVFSVDEAKVLSCQAFLLFYERAM